MVNFGKFQKIKMMIIILTKTYSRNRKNQSKNGIYIGIKSTNFFDLRNNQNIWHVFDLFGGESFIQLDIFFTLELSIMKCQ